MSSGVDIFEKILTGSFSSANTRLTFDTEILLPNSTDEDFDKMIIDQSFRALKRDDLKVGYKLKLNKETEYFDRRIVSKILKLDEKNQYGFTMTKLMPAGGMKKNSMSEFNILLKTVHLDDKIDHLFAVDIEATHKQMMYNEIFPPIIDKQKIRRN